MNPRVWFKSISLENVRSFGTKQTINFTDKEGNAARWNVILGNNGTGKTTVLKGLAIVFYVSELDKKYTDSLSRNVDQDSKIDINLNVNNKIIGPYNFELPPLKRQYNQSVFYTSTMAGPVRTYRSDVDDLTPNLFTYGAGRKIGNSGLTKEDAVHIINLFDEEASLINAEEWIVQADYISLKENKFKNRYQKVLNLLRELLRDEVEDIYIY